MSEVDYFEQFAGDVPPRKCEIGMVGDDDFSKAESFALQWLDHARVHFDFVGVHYKLDYVHNPGSPSGEHQFHIIEERDIG